MRDSTRSCWLGHKWSKWLDKASISRKSTAHGGEIANGIQQERRCERCNKVQIHIAWNTDIH